MHDSKVGVLAHLALATLSKALTLLEVGQLGIVSFGDSVDIVHPSDQPFTDEVGARLLSRFSFQQGGGPSTAKNSMAQLLEMCQPFLESQAAQQSGSSSARCSQLMVIISDGRFGCRERVQLLINQCLERQQLPLLVIVDNPEENMSITDLTKFEFVNGKPKSSPYLENYPFPFYVLLRDIRQLPQVLSDTMRQWFEIISAQD